MAAATSGPWLGRTHKRGVGKRNPDPGGDRIPVVYVTTPPKGSPRKLASEFAHFPGLPDRARYNTTDIAAAANGRKGGRPRKIDDADAAKARQLRRKGIAVSDIAKMLGVSRATVYRYFTEAPAA